MATHDVVYEIADERLKQRAKWGNGHDDLHQTHHLALAAAAYAVADDPDADGAYLDTGLPPSWWPWLPTDWRPEPTARRNLVKAAALIVAEIERIDRITEDDEPQAVGPGGKGE